jgi:hypothetical protein
MSTTITAPEPIEPDNELPVPSPGQDVNQWGDILNEETFPMLLAYILWLKENGGGGGGPVAAEDVTYDNGTSGLTAEDVQNAIDELASEKANISDLGTAAAADASDFATAAQGALADTALQPGDELTALAATGITAGYVPKADGAGGINWAEETGGGGGGSGIDPSDGLVVVQHGDDGNAERPAAAVVLWRGSADPTNAAAGDLWDDSEDWD